MLDLLFVYPFFSSAITANKIILFTMSASLLVAIRMLSASLLLFVFSYFNKKHWITWNKLKVTLVTLIVIAFCTTYLNSNLKAYALKNMPSYKAAFFGTLDPFITAIMSYFLLSERLNPRKIIGILFGFAGAIVLLVSHAPIEEQLKAFYFFSYPEIAALSAIVFSRFGWILIQKYLKKGVYTPVQINIQTMFIGGVLSLLAVYFYGNFDIDLSNLDKVLFFNYFPFNYFNNSTLLLLTLAYTIIIGNLIGYNLYSIVLKRYSATFVSLAGFSIPLLVAFYGWLLLGEQLTSSYFISCILTFIGLFIFFKEERITRVIL